MDECKNNIQAKQITDSTVLRIRVSVTPKPCKLKLDLWNIYSCYHAYTGTHYFTCGYISTLDCHCEINTTQIILYINIFYYTYVLSMFLIGLQLYMYFNPFDGVLDAIFVRLLPNYLLL